MLIAIAEIKISDVAADDFLPSAASFTNIQT
jgi:hypothetical protein